MNRFRMHRNEKVNLAIAYNQRMEAGQTLSAHAISIFLGTTDKSGDFTITSVGSSTTVLTDFDGNDIPIGQATIFTLEGSDALTDLGIENPYDVRGEATLVETGEKMIAQDKTGDAPQLIVSGFAEVP